MTLGDSIRHFRNKANLRQIDVANKLNINKSAYAAYEEDRATPPPVVLYALCQLYACTLEDLIMGATEIKPQPEKQFYARYLQAEDNVRKAIDLLLK